MAVNAGISKPKNPLRESRLGPMVTVQVGNHSFVGGCEDFYVHENLLGTYAPFFKKLCPRFSQGASTKTFKLGFDSPDTFARFVQWMYTGDFDTSHRKKLDELFDVYVFAEKIQVSRLKDETINKLVECPNVTRQAMGFDHIELAFGKTQSLSPLRKWVIREVNRRSRWFFGFPHHMQRYPELLFECACFSAYGFGGRTSSRPYGRFPLLSNCLLHEHRENGYCKWKENEEPREEPMEVLWEES